jgi:peptide/nickel transport system substrate-binding protein
VRKALLLAIDRQGMADSLYKGFGTVPNNVTFPTTLGHDTSLKPYPYDPAQAKQLLKAAGQENLSIDFTTYSATSSFPNVQTLVQAVAGYWKQIGVKVNITVLDGSTYLPKVRDHAYRGAIVLGSPAITFFDPLNFYVFYKSTGPYSTISDPAMDKVFDQIAAATSQESKAAVAKQMSDMLYNNLWGLPIVSVDSIHAIGPHVDSWQLMRGNPYSGPFWKLEAK